MPIDRVDRDAIFDTIHYRIIDVLESWMINEKGNLDGFIAHPEGHIDYSPYLILDFDSLRYRSGMLAQIAGGLNIISRYKKGDETVTRTMHDYAVDHIPNVIWKRLHDWTGKRSGDMQDFLTEKANSPPVPIDDYRSAASFNVEAYIQEMQMYVTATNALVTTMQFAIEEGLST